LIGFPHGWQATTISYTEFTAGAPVIFADYVIRLTHWPVDPRFIAIAAIAVIVFINVLGILHSSTWQKYLVTLKVRGLELLETNQIAPLHAAVLVFLSGDRVRVHAQLLGQRRRLRSSVKLF
jgi:hypothetical protein